tara:strand:+ start:550 stop:825 length:276 start_codon:yes stop_codon:yes gene_type:complete
MIARTLTVHNYDDLREALPTSGIFEMDDISVEILCPEISEIEEVQRMVALIESMVHVTDVRIGSDIQNLISDDYRVTLTKDTTTNKKKFIR